jgi:DNA topoisomerase-1
MLVESPSKAKTISKILNSDYVVLASYGHIKDLPKNRLGFDTNDFTPEYNITPDKRKVVNDIKHHYDKDTIVYLGSDFDREGHLIAQHLIEVLGIPKERYKRIEFHEITKEAIMHAIANPVELEVNLANAAMARRILDRAVGYELSPLLWKKVRFGLSAGRVQSVTVRILTDREEEINAFIPEEFWKIKAEFINPELKSDLVKISGKNIKISTQSEANHIETSLKLGTFQLVDIEEKESIRNPAPPFTTSTLQQEASRKLGSSVKQTMQTAQQLYEGNVGSIPGHTGGLITYMRTDAVNLSTLATSMAKKVIEQEYGKEYSLEYPRKYISKSKGAQEAHEAIRPVNLALKPSDIKPYVDNYQFKLYELIWKRTLATQMTSAKVANTTYKILAGKNKECEFQTKGQRIIFPGYMKAYTEGSDNPESALDNIDKILPNISKGTILNIDKILPEQNFTKPPARYTEASLVGKLEKEGIGRPSTYASTISTIISRGYVVIDGDKKLIPTPTGEVVVKFLKEQFPYIVDLKFTANIEEKFDEIASGKIPWKKVISEFYNSMKKDITEKESSISKETYLQVRELGTDPVSGKPVTVRNGRFGQFVQIGTKEDEDKPKFANLPSHLSMNKITLEEALPLFAMPRIVGKDKDGKDIKANIGKFGPYLEVSKVYYPLRDKDPYTVDLDTALQVIKDTEEWRKNNPPKDRPKGVWKRTFKKK